MGWIDKFCGELTVVEGDFNTLSYCECSSMYNDDEEIELFSTHQTHNTFFHSLDNNNEIKSGNNNITASNGTNDGIRNESKPPTINRLSTFPLLFDDESDAIKKKNSNMKEIRSFIDIDDIDDDMNENLQTIFIEKEKRISNAPFCEYVLPYEAMTQLSKNGLPPGILFCTWKRIYSLARDGDSCEIMLRLVKNEKRSLLVVRTTKGEIFGGFVTSPWTTESNGSFYGSGQSMLFRVLNGNLNTTTAMMKQSNDGSETFKITTPSNMINVPGQRLELNKNDGFRTEDNNKVHVIVYKWTGVNHLIQACDSEKKNLALGGGGKKGNFGLCINGDLKKGSTGRCETFDNEPLTGDGRECFDILDIEIWGFSTCKWDL